MQALKTTGYTIYFNEDCYSHLHQILIEGNYSTLFVIVDSNTAKYCLPNFLSQVATELPIEIIEIEAGEINKSIETCIEVWHALTELHADRKSIVINLGGGVVTDLGGFVSSTFKRGMDFINVPTSLLAMVDASVGGKTGVDLGRLKNQIGVINTPVAVLVDTAFLETLPSNEMRSGLAEMLKHGLIADAAYWRQFSDLTSLTTDDLGLLIYHSIEIKNTFAEEDPREKGIRKALNFGHTIGHAIESYCLASSQKETLLHGEAIAIGMIIEAYLSLQLNFISSEEYYEIKYIITGIFEKVSFNDKDVNEIMNLLVHDKKNVSGEVQFVLLDKIGKTVINKTVENSLIIKGFEEYQN
ncbi:3-dehydroquinate synthase [Flavobacterium sp. DG1-102-2]|uniref:3-dehydroquinate synthase n=1 Tax=Flavobacterium sp. DG1-102-2 TaxID=3081663 RepID=UPI002949AF62|nr:3-dehydroquinate synthase [Flavobacterium sp. DG1-102-2]MDV6167272.1 3-dehydroquinate synthase [Flavobacterium sp. DG1-102-2]